MINIVMFFSSVIYFYFLIGVFVFFGVELILVVKINLGKL